MWRRAVLAVVIVTGLSACSLVGPEPARQLGFLIENRTGRNVDFFIGPPDDVTTGVVVAACDAVVIPGVIVREGDTIALSDGGEVWRFDTVPGRTIGGMRVTIHEDRPAAVSVMDVDDRVPQAPPDDLC